ncbi:MAG: hypothetical protein KDJ48_06590 [Nitratireductor sp.]|nr:hypothetical protein [Nitratireductor sp.]
MAFGFPNGLNGKEVDIGKPSCNQTVRLRLTAVIPGGKALQCHNHFAICHRLALISQRPGHNHQAMVDPSLRGFNTAHHHDWGAGIIRWRKLVLLTVPETGVEQCELYED